MKVAVTGGSGFIGSHVVDRLVGAGHDVRVLDCAVRTLNPAVTYVEGDVADLATLSEVVAGTDAVFHLAGVSNVDAAYRNPMATVRTNVEGTANVLEAVRTTDAGRVLLASTVWVYGAAAAVDGGPLSEDVPLDPARVRHVYTASKVAAETLLHSYRELYGVPFTVLRYGIPYGPRMRDELVIARFVQRALAREPLAVAGDGRQTRNYVYVEDLADAHVRALRPEAVDQVFALEGPTAVSIRQIAETVRAVLDTDVVIESVPARPGDYAGQPVSAAKARRLLGWRADTTFAEGVRRYVEWYTADRDSELATSE